MSALRAARLRPVGRAGQLAARIARRPRALAALVAILILGGSMWLWLRDSPLVSIDRVTVTGAAGPEASSIRSALMTAARGMTTLDVNVTQLRTAVSPFPEVKALRVSTQLPHGLRIAVVEELPVAAVAFGGRSEAVTSDGTLLHSVAASSLPTISLSVPPGGSRLTDPAALAEVRALAAAPYQLLGHIQLMTTASGHGLTAQLRHGPVIYLGDASHMAAKWAAALAVLADAGSAGAGYIDVTDPGRPAAGAQAATGSPAPASTSGAPASAAGSSPGAAPSTGVPSTAPPGG